MKCIKKCIAVVSAVAMVAVGLNQTVIKDNAQKILAQGKTTKAVLLAGNDQKATYYTASANFFDYNTSGVWEGYNVYGFQNGNSSQSSYWLQNCGVNLDIRSHFAKDQKDRSEDSDIFLFGGERHKYQSQADFNQWTGSNGGVYQGLVKNALNNDGSLGFNVNSINLFPSTKADASAHITPYYNVGFMFEKNEDGYYVFDSDSNKVCNVASGSGIELGFDYTKVGPEFSTKTGSKQRNYGFFPFNTDYDNDNQADQKRHHMFGMELNLDFYLNSQKTVNGKDMEFTFSGDDDVWIYVDGKLVLDLGGIHDKAGGSINFKTGKITYNTKVAKVCTGTAVSIPTTLSDAGVDLKTGNHTLKMFYLERGESDSNCMISFNLGVGEEPTPTPVVTTPVVTPTVTPEVTATPTVVPTTPAATVTPIPPVIIVTPTPPIIIVTPTLKVTETPKVTATPEITETPKVTATPEITETPKVTATPEVTETPEITEEPVITSDPVPMVPVTPQVAEETVAPNVPKPTETPVAEITEAPVPEGPVATATSAVEETATPVTTATTEIVDEDTKPAGDVSNDDSDNKKTIVIENSTPGSLPKTGGIAGMMENGKAVSYTVIAFLLGSAAIFSVGKIKRRKVRK